MGKKIFIKTFGCQMNVYDSNRIFHSVKKIGFEKTEDQKNADCFLLNTCHIRDKAKEKVYHEIGRVKKIYKNYELILVDDLSEGSALNLPKVLRKKLIRKRI